MINFLKISNNIRSGDYLHSNGNIDNNSSPDIIGLCVIPSNFLPDGLARFMSLRIIFNCWDRKIQINNNYKIKVPGKHIKELFWGYYNKQDSNYSLISPYLSNGQFNSDFLIDLPQGNVFQDYKGYENTRLYREKYGDSKYLDNAFSSCFRISPLYRNSDWYLPSIGELALLYEKRVLIDEKIDSARFAGSPGVTLFGNGYWSSSECGPDYAFSANMYDDSVDFSNKYDASYVRPFLTL